MTTIIEEFVSFETAKLLKEKGFNQELDWVYSNKNGEVELHYDVNEDGYGTTNDYKGKNFLCISPTQQMAMRWLREVHNIHISVYVFNRELPITNIPMYTCDIATEKLSSQQGHLRGVWESYEQACEAAIKYCLKNLI